MSERSASPSIPKKLRMVRPRYQTEDDSLYETDCPHAHYDVLNECRCKGGRQKHQKSNDEHPVVAELAGTLAEVQTKMLASANAQLDAAYHRMLALLVDTSTQAQSQHEGYGELLSTLLLPLGDSLLQFAEDEPADGATASTARLKDRMRRLEVGLARHEETLAKLLARWSACLADIRAAEANLQMEAAREWAKAEEIEAAAGKLEEELHHTCETALAAFRAAERP